MSANSPLLEALPHAVLVEILRHVVRNGACRPQSIRAAAICCKMFAAAAQDPLAYDRIQFDSRRLMDNAPEPGCIGSLISLLSHPRFTRMSVLDLSGLSAVSTKLINRKTYRAALPKPTWNYLEVLELHHGVFNTIAHIFSLLPQSLRVLCVSDGPRWVSPSMIDVLAYRCPNLQAIDLSFAKASEPWFDCLEAVAARFPRLVALDIAYAGYGSGAGRIETSEGFEALLRPIGKLTELRYLDVSYLGLDGSYSHTQCYSESTKPLEALIDELPQLQYFIHTPQRKRITYEVPGHPTDVRIELRERVKLAHPHLKFQKPFSIGGVYNGKINSYGCLLGMW